MPRNHLREVTKITLYRNEQWLREEVEIKGRTYQEIAEQFGVHYNTIANRARSYSITHHSNKRNEITKQANELLRDKEWLYEQYITLNKSYTEICEEFSVKRSTLGRWVQRHKLHKPLEDKLKEGSPSVIIQCKLCEKEVKKKPSAIRNGGKFCSQSCSSTYHYYNGVGEKMHRGSELYYMTPRGKAIARENGKRASMMLANGHKTSIEIAIEDELSRRGIKFESQKEYKLGIADVFIKPNIYVFADGDYWHAKSAVEGKTKPTPKQREQIAKDIRQTNYLKASGNIVLRFWESEINASVEACVDIILAVINEKEAIA